MHFMSNAFIVNAFMPNSFMQTVFMHLSSGQNWIMIDCYKTKQIDRASNDLYYTIWQLQVIGITSKISQILQNQ